MPLDHVNGGGFAEYRKYNGYSRLYKKILGDTEGRYQLLCANCNWIKRYENNEVKRRG